MRTSILVVLLPALLVAWGCASPQFQAGNLKEKREKKSEYREAQRKLEEQEAQRAVAAADAAAADPTDGAAGRTSADAAAAGAAGRKNPAAGAEDRESAEGDPPDRVTGLAVAAETATVDPAVLDILGPRFVVTVEDSGGPREIVLHRAQIGHYERRFKLSGQVEDLEIIGEALVFQRDLSLFRRKLKKLARVEFVPSEEPTRTRLRLRLHFRKQGKKPEEFPLEELMGAAHPVPPFLLGVGPKGSMRFPLFSDGGDSVSTTIRELNLTPDL